VTAHLMRVNQVRADSNRVFELRVYHALPGKLPTLESRFPDRTAKLLATQSGCRGLLGRRGNSGLGHAYRYGCSFQPGGSEKKMECF
jgi:hypothetical protein